MRASLLREAALGEGRNAGEALIDALANVDGGTHPAVTVVTTPDGHDRSLSYAPSVRAVLDKPFRIEELAEVVTTCCETN